MASSILDRVKQEIPIEQRKKLSAIIAFLTLADNGITKLIYMMPSTSVEDIKKEKPGEWIPLCKMKVHSGISTVDMPVIKTLLYKGHTVDDIIIGHLTTVVFYNVYFTHPGYKDSIVVTKTTDRLDRYENLN